MTWLRWILLLSVSAVACGCGSAPPLAKPTSPERRQAYGKLEGLRRTQHPELQAELARLHAENALPEQLDQGQPPEAAADPLLLVLPHFSRRALTEQVDDVFPRGDFALGPAERLAARGILSRQQSARERFAAVIAEERGRRSLFTDGWLSSPDFWDGCQLGARLHGLAGADLLADNAAQSATEALRVVLQTADVLDRQDRLTARLAGAKVRGEGLRLALAIARHPACDLPTLARLNELLEQTLASRPSDARALFGERALGLQMFELVRDGYFLSLLDEDETKSLQERNILLVTAKAALQNVDADEWFYLQAMRRLIAAGERPYCGRRELLTTLRRELETRRNTADFPLVSGMVLLHDFDTAQRRLAEDHARTIALRVAVQRAAGSQLATDELNPLTGRPFRVELESDRVVVRDILPAGDEPLTLPLRRQTTSLPR